MKPAISRKNMHQAFILFVKLALALGLLIGICSNQIVAQDKSSKPKLTDEELKKQLWQSEKLPVDAIVRYGSTDRNPFAIGIYALKFSSDGKLLAARDRRQNVRILDLENRNVVAILPTQAIRDFVISPENEFLITGSRKILQFWNIATGEIEREVSVEGHRLAVASEPAALVSVGKGTVKRFRWPFPSKPIVIQTNLPGATVLPSGVSSGGELAIFHNGGQSEILDAVSGAPIIPAPEAVPKHAIISPNLRLMVDLNYGDPNLKIFDLSNPKKYQHTLKDKRRIVTAAFSCDSRFLYTSNYDNSIVVWDLVTMKSVHRGRGHQARIYTLAANPIEPFRLASGASGSGDRSVLYWDFRDRLFPPIVDTQWEFDFDNVWAELGSEEADVSLQATSQLAHAIKRDPQIGNQLIERLGLNQGVDEPQASKLISDLDAPKYEVRENATTKLKSMVDRIRPMLERRLENSSQEAKWRISRILSMERLRPEIMTVKGRRNHRVVLALELCGSQAALDTLETIVESSSNPNMVAISKEAISRF